MNEILLLLIVVACIFYLGGACTRCKNTSIGTGVKYLVLAYVLFGGIRLFFALREWGVFSLEEMSMMIWWHIQFYLAIGSLIIGLRTLSRLADITQAEKDVFPFLPYCTVSMVLVIFLFLTALPFNLPVQELTEGTFLDWSGLLHFIAVVMAGTSAIYAWKLKKKFPQTLGMITLSLFVSLSFFAFIHAWELTTESWKLVSVEGELVEFVETLLWYPAVLALAYAAVRFVTSSKDQLHSQ